MRCPGCAREVEGRFCGFCGTSLENRSCGECGAEVPSAHDFCSRCGAAVAGGDGVPATPRPDRSGSPERTRPPEGTRTPDRTRWWILGGAVAGALLFLAVPYVWTGWADGGGGERMPMGAPGGGSGLGPAPGVDLSTMTPRQAADRLYNRVMSAMTAGDQGEVDAFLPMAIDAYRLVPDLDADGHFHLSLLEQAAGRDREGLATAEQALDSSPDHLLLLYAAAEAARRAGETERAERYFRRIVEVFEEESARTLPEYVEHASFLPAIRTAATDFLDGRG